MRLLELIRPSGAQGPDWERLVAERSWARELEWTDVDRTSHREGSVLEHVRMAHAALRGLPGFERLSAYEKDVLELAAVLHDLGRVYTTRVRGERVVAPGHPRRGEIVARRILWEEGADFRVREAVCALIRFHEEPFELLSAEDARRRILAISVVSRCDHLALLAEADARGRVSGEAGEQVASVEMFRQQARELGCLDHPFPFASDHSRFLYFRREDRNPFYEAFDDTRGEAILLSGLPGSGKSTWIARHAPPDYEVIGLDETRARMGIPHAADQGPVLQRTREEAKRIMGAKHERRSFVWNATNLSRERRAPLIELFERYDYRVRIVYLEVPPEEGRRQNEDREDVVPAEAIERMLWHWEVPDLTEAQRVDWIVRTAAASSGPAGHA